MEREEKIRELLLTKLNELSNATGIQATQEQYQTLLTNYINSNYSLDQIEKELNQQLEEKKSYYNYEHHREEVINSYKSGVNELKDDENCYIVGYQDGKKTIAAAALRQVGIIETSYTKPKKVIIDGDESKTGFLKDSRVVNSYLDDMEMVINQAGYILGIDMAKTYRVFDFEMNPIGLLSENCCQNINEKFYDFSELPSLVLRNSRDLKVVEWLKNYIYKFPFNSEHDISKTNNPDYYRVGIDFTLKVIEGLPEITELEKRELRQKYLDMKVFELFTNSIDSNLTNYGVVVSYSNGKIKYRFASLFDKAVVSMPERGNNKTTLNNFICDKKDLMYTLITYYPETRKLFKLIVQKQEVIMEAIKIIAKDFLEYGVFNEYQNILLDNANYFTNLVNNLPNETLSESDQLEEMESSEVLDSRCQSLMNSRGVRKAKSNTLVLANANAPSIISDEDGKIDIKFLLFVVFAIVAISYIVYKFITI